MMYLYYLLIGIIIAAVIFFRTEVINSIVNMARVIILKCNNDDEEQTEKDVQDSLNEGQNIGYNMLNQYGSNARIVLFIIIALSWPLLLLLIIVESLCYLYLKNK